MGKESMGVSFFRQVIPWVVLGGPDHLKILGTRTLCPEALGPGGYFCKSKLEVGNGTI